jgi:hypothetical protein
VNSHASAVYVYGVGAAAELGPVAAAGVQDVTVLRVEHGDLVALASELKDGALAAAREVRAHWRVLDEASQGATVLPTRFGTVMESEQAVRDGLLAPHADRLRELLRSLAGRVQLNVKGDYDEDKILSQVVASSPAILALRDKLRTLPEAAGYYERIRLGELVADEVERRRAADTERALDTLSGLAAEARQEQLSQPYNAYKLAFLVERDHQDAFSAAVDQLATEQADTIAIRYVGPLPPYSFAEAELTPEAQAWA